jgi:hypothetical protein
MADAGQLAGELRGSGELLDLEWFPLREALELPIIDVTAIVLKEVARWTGSQCDGLDRQPPSLVFVSYRRETPILRTQPAGRR